MRGFLAIGQYAAIVLCVSPTFAQAADEPLLMAPSSNWIVDYADDSCALRRAFQSGDEQAMLELRQFGPGDFFQVTLVSSTLSRTSRPPKVRFEPDDEFFEPAGALFLGDEEMRGVLYSDWLRPTADKRLRPPLPDWPAADRDARERAITGLSISGSFERPFTLQTGSMHAPMKAMRTCLDELVTHWGLDPAVQRTLSRAAAPTNLQSWSNRLRAALPPEALRDDRSGVVTIRVIVGPDGKPTNCLPHSDFSSPGFAAEACEKTMEYARFEPALDASGMPVAGSYFFRLRY